MATSTAIVIGRSPDGQSSVAYAVVNETFTSVFDVPVSLAKNEGNQGVDYRIEASSVTVTTTDELTTYVEGVDYTISYTKGTVTVLSTGGMLDATGYYIDYQWQIVDITVKINDVTTGSVSFEVTTLNIGNRTIAIIVYT